MCGIAGILQFKKEINIDLFKGMTKLMSHRGPDDEGYLFGNIKLGTFDIVGGADTQREVYASKFPYSPYSGLVSSPNSQYNLALGNRRLAIIDLSPAGHQPMSNEDRTIWIVHNGEIYNYKEIRDELKAVGYKFFSNSDTEVIINAYQEWNQDCLMKFNGMWAFCIWDVKKQKLFCARDRFGIKPFYFYLDNEMFAFASEIKPLLHLNIKKKPNDSVIYDFLKYGLLDHTNETFFKEIRKLPPAHYLTINFEGNLNIQRYWDVEISNRVNNKNDQLSNTQEFLDIFIDAVKLRLRSDVPIGSCLSGGLDSSSIVCVANDLMFPEGNLLDYNRQKTFSACFNDKHFDEREYIEEVIKNTNVERNYVFPDPDGFLRTLDNLLWHQEEPFGGTSIYAQWCVIRRAKEKGVKVLLDGQGGDEQLCGYRKFYIFYLFELLKKKKIFRFLFEFLSFFLSIEIIKTINLSQGARYFNFGNKIMRIDDFLLDSFKKEFRNQYINLGYQGNLGKRIKEDLFKFSLPVLLRYEDKNSMAHSVEARLPFLDYRLVEKIASFPLTQKIRNGWTKYILREAMAGYLPEKIRLRKSKIGFDTPEDKWFKMSIFKILNAAFNESFFIRDYVKKEILLKYLKKFKANKSFHHSDIFFRFFILELWGRKFLM